jgi:glycosyltransferase involved in cell wall biosynthesis
MKHKISIALCTYNGAKYLPSQLESYLAQTRPPDEVVACDDRSQDETVRKLKEFAELAPFPMRIFVNEQNIGSTKNFEKAISHCSGDIIFLSDQDDVWAPNKVERLTGEFDNDNEVGMAFSDSELVDETLQPLGISLYDAVQIALRHCGRINQENLFSTLLLGRNGVFGHALAFRAEYKKSIIPIPTDIPRVIHDLWIAFVISAAAKVVFLDEPLVKYRQHAQQQIGIDPRKAALQTCEPGTQAEQRCKPSRISFVEDIWRGWTARKEFIELIASHITSRIQPPRHIMSAVKAEITYCQELAWHYQLRNSFLSDKRMMRLRPIIKELLSGGYHRCSSGVRSAVGDFVKV